MRLDKIVLHSFLSHTDTTWEPDGARLVSLVGANGAGKSSLLDAVAFTLYDSARGRTDDLVTIGATDMSARVEFELGDAHYAVERGRTRKGGGKSYLELQVRDGESWRPLTGESIRDTQEAIAGLLRMDASTFAQSALLMQGRLNAFAEATAAERKRVLVQVLGLDVYARAEQLARGKARDLEARIAAERGQLERLDARLAERPAAEWDLTEATMRLGGVSDGIDALDARARTLAIEIAALDARLAAGEAQQRLAAQLEARVEELAVRYRTTRARRDAARGDGERALEAIRAGAGVDEALVALPGARAALEALERARDEAASLETQVRTRREAHAVASADARQADATWTAQYEAARTRVDELTAALGALVATPCPACGTPVTPGRDDLEARLTEAANAYRKLDGHRPKAPLSLSIEAGQITRLEARLRDLAHDPAALRAADALVRSLERTAAQAAAVEAARASLASAEASIAAAADELVRISDDGGAARSALEAARAELAELEPFRAERELLAVDAASVGAELARARREYQAAQAADAAARATLDQLDRVALERADLATTVEALVADADLARRLAAAFGVTGIPARIIEGVLPELEMHANELLADLRPGMTVAIRAQRAKKDGSGVVEALDLVVCDAAGERPLAMFSGGERMSVSLALAVGLSRLVARRAGTAVRTLVIDEPDGLDAEARRAFGQSLRVLAHRGELERVVLVSHHEDLADAADAVYVVSKNGHGSSVELVS